MLLYMLFSPPECPSYLPHLENSYSLFNLLHQCHLSEKPPESGVSLLECYGTSYSPQEQQPPRLVEISLYLLDHKYLLLFILQIFTMCLANEWGYNDEKNGEL